MDNQYMYVFVREDLSVAQQIVQTSHATYEVGSVVGLSKSPNFVLIGVKSEPHLHQVREMLQEHQIDCKMFFEPDINQHTAIATEPITGDSRKLFKKYELFKR